MVRKFVTWKTNKESETDEYPAFVLHFTDFSPNRKDPLAREVRVSSSQEQINTLLEEMIEENIKKGWELHTSLVVDTQAAARAQTKEATDKEPPAKKQVAAKPKLAPSEATRKRATKKKSG